MAASKKRWTKQIGELEEVVLATILRLENRAYGVQIIDEIEGLTGRQVSSGALSITLDRLERKGFVTSAASAPDPDRGGRPRREVCVTSAGLLAAKEARTAKLRLWSGLDTVFDES